jgi:hypothetical protein
LESLFIDSICFCSFTTPAELTSPTGDRSIRRFHWNAFFSIKSTFKGKKTSNRGTC